MARGKITDKAISSLRREAVGTKQPVILWDSEVRGFGAKALPSGTLTWLFQYYIGKKQKRVTYAAADLEDARKRASKFKVDADDGVDILNRKQQKRLEQIARLDGAKLGETVDRYLKRQSEDNSYWEQVGRIFKGTTWGDGTKRTEGIVGKLGKDTLVASITKADVRALIDAKQDAGSDGMARYVFAVLRPFFAWCVERDYITASPMASLSAPSPLAARDRILTDPETKAFWEATLAMSEGERDHASKPDPVFGAFYRVLLLTAQRREEVAGMAWSEVDLDKALWIIPGSRTKNGKEHTVHLSPQAIAALKQVERMAGSDLVFTTTGINPISGYSKAKARLDKLMSVPAWRVHDLRRTAASGMAKLGFQPHIVERVLNHISGAQGGLVAVYQRYEYLEERKRAIEAWGSYVAALIGDMSMADNIVAIRA